MEYAAPELTRSLEYVIINGRELRVTIEIRYAMQMKIETTNIATGNATATHAEIGRVTASNAHIDDGDTNIYTHTCTRTLERNRQQTTNTTTTNTCAIVAAGLSLSARTELRA